MGDECTCEKCQAGSLNAQDTVVWPIGAPEAKAEVRIRMSRDQYVIIRESGISLRQQTSEM